MPLRIHTSSWASFLSKRACCRASAASELLAPLQERRVVAGPVVEPAAVELDDPGGQPLEEDPVVGDEDERAAVAEQEVLEPADRLDVEVVGRLVEQQDVGLGDERPGQQHAPLHARGEVVEPRVGVEPHPGDDRVRRGGRAADG